MATHIHGTNNNLNVMYMVSKPTPDLISKQRQKIQYIDPSTATYSAPAKYGGTTPIKPPKRLRNEDTQITRCKRKLDFARLGLPVQRHNPVVAAKRNERERNRVKHINETFTVLRDHLPGDYNTIQKANKEMSKVEILRAAIDYIQTLEQMLTGKLQISSDIDLKALIQASTSPDSKSPLFQHDEIADFIKRESMENVQSPSPASQNVEQTVVPSMISQQQANVTPQLQFQSGTDKVKISSDLNDNEVKCYSDFMNPQFSSELIQHNQISQSHQFDAMQLDNLLSNNNTLQLKPQLLVTQENAVSWPQQYDPVLSKGLNNGVAYGQVPSMPSPALSTASSACDQTTKSTCDRSITVASDQTALFDNIDLTDVDFTSLLMSM